MEKCELTPSEENQGTQAAAAVAADAARDSRRVAVDSSIDEKAHVEAVQALEDGSVISQELHDLALADEEARKLDVLAQALR